MGTKIIEHWLRPMVENYLEQHGYDLDECKREMREGVTSYRFSSYGRGYFLILTLQTFGDPETPSFGFKVEFPVGRVAAKDGAAVLMSVCEILATNNVDLPVRPRLENEEDGSYTLVLSITANQNVFEDHYVLYFVEMGELLAQEIGEKIGLKPLARAA